MNANGNDGNQTTGAAIPAYHPRHQRAAHNLAAFAGLINKPVASPNGWLFYDAACPFCTRAAKTIQPTLLQRQLYVLPLQTLWVQKLLAERHEPLLKEIRFLTADGKLHGGADALIEVARRIWWTRPFAWIARMPGMINFLRRGYEFMAGRRHCLHRNKSLAARRGFGLKFRLFRTEPK